MKYATGEAFRSALETQLNKIQKRENIPMPRLRKQVVFERFIARLQIFQPDTWILKGGLAMQLRLGVNSRTTKDIDLLNNDPGDNLFNSLVSAALIDTGDWFSFEVSQSTNSPQNDFGGQRFQIVCQVGGREFERFPVDVRVGDVLVEKYDTLHFEPFLEFADIPTIEIPCYPVTQQIAEKIHALTREYASGPSSRVKDVVDILLLAGMGEFEGGSLSRTIHATFDFRKTHSVPQKMATLPKTLRPQYTKMANELGLKFEDFDDAEAALAEFIDPVFQKDDPGTWNASKWQWG